MVKAGLEWARTVTASVPVVVKTGVVPLDPLTDKSVGVIV